MEHEQVMILFQDEMSKQRSINILPSLIELEPMCGATDGT